MEVVEEATAHHIPPHWWASALAGLAAHHASNPANAGPAIAALVALERTYQLSPSDRAVAEEARARARAELGPAAVSGWEIGASEIELQHAALALIAED